jgi:hypothetical protein
MKQTLQEFIDALENLKKNGASEDGLVHIQTPSSPDNHITGYKIYSEGGYIRMLVEEDAL